MASNAFHVAVDRNKFAGFRRLVYQRIPLELELPGLRLTEINNTAIAAQKSWMGEGREPPNGGWDWSHWIHETRRSNHRAFEVAIWQGNELCGLCLGTPNKKRLVLRVELIEGSPYTNHPLRGKIAMIALTAAEAYAIVLGSNEVRIMDPVEGALKSYLKLDYVQQKSSKKEKKYLSKFL